MEDLVLGFQLFLVISLSGAVYANLLAPGKFPIIPGDINIEKGGFKIYIPFVSALVVAGLVVLILNQAEF